MGDVPPDDPGVAPPFHNLEVDEDGVATPAGIDTSTEAVYFGTGAPTYKASHLIAALVAERDEARAVLAAVPDDVRRLAEAVVDIEVSGVLPEGWTVSSDDLNPDLLIVSEPEEIRFALEPHDDEWSCEDDTRVTFGPTAVEAVRAALAAAGVEAPAAGTDGGA